MKEWKYQIDGTCGPLVRAGERVTRGQKLGIGMHEFPVLSEIDGMVSGISFVGPDHYFIIRVKARKDRSRTGPGD